MAWGIDSMLRLYVQAPFAACRTFTAGWYRPTATFLTPSAAYGLILNVAGIESRLREEEPGHDEKTPGSLVRAGLPGVRIALGAPHQPDGDHYPRVQQAVYQQLHNYPVGSSGKERAASARGNKHNITPVRREVLTDLKAVIWLENLDTTCDIEDRVRRGLRGEFNSTRYGLPFLGDNSFLLDRLEVCEGTPLVHWFRRIDAKSSINSSLVLRATRLTIQIDRADMSRTVSALFAPMENPLTEVPDTAKIELRSTNAPP